MFMRQIGTNYYWYETKREKGKTRSFYLGKATTEEVKEHRKKARKK